MKIVISLFILIALIGCSHLYTTSVQVDHKFPSYSELETICDMSEQQISFILGGYYGGYPSNSILSHSIIGLSQDVSVIFSPEEDFFIIHNHEQKGATKEEERIIRSEIENLALTFEKYFKQKPNQ